MKYKLFYLIFCLFFLPIISYSGPRDLKSLSPTSLLELMGQIADPKNNYFCPLCSYGNEALKAKGNFLTREKKDNNTNVLFHILRENSASAYLMQKDAFRKLLNNIHTAGISNNSKPLKAIVENYRNKKNQIDIDILYQFTENELIKTDTKNGDIHDFYGFVHSKKDEDSGITKAKILLNQRQNTNSATLTLGHELFHLFDPYVAKLDGKIPSPLERTTFEFRANKFELLLHDALKKSSKNFETHKRLKKLLDSGASDYDIFLYTLEKNYPTTSLNRWGAYPQSDIYINDNQDPIQINSFGNNSKISTLLSKGCVSVNDGLSGARDSLGHITKILKNESNTPLNETLLTMIKWDQTDKYGKDKSISWTVGYRDGTKIFLPGGKSAYELLREKNKAIQASIIAKIKNRTGLSDQKKAIQKYLRNPRISNISKLSNEVGFVVDGGAEGRNNGD